MMWPVALEDVERPDPIHNSIGWYVWHLGEIMAVFDREDEARYFAACWWSEVVTIAYVADPKTWQPSEIKDDD